MAYELAGKAVLITPARFLFNAGSAPAAWNEKMLSSEHLKVVSYEAKSANIFPNTDIKGGVAITLYGSTRNFGKIGTFTAYPELTAIAKKAAPDNEMDSLASVVYIQNRFNLDISAVESLLQLSRNEGWLYKTKDTRKTSLISNNVLRIEKWLDNRPKK